MGRFKQGAVTSNIRSRCDTEATNQAGAKIGKDVTDAADRLEGAVADVIREGKSVTYDMKKDRSDPSAVGTREMAQAICEKVSAKQLGGKK